MVYLDSYNRMLCNAMFKQGWNEKKENASKDITTCKEKETMQRKQIHLSRAGRQ